VSGLSAAELCVIIEFQALEARSYLKSYQTHTIQEWMAAEQLHFKKPWSPHTTDCNCMECRLRSGTDSLRDVYYVLGNKSVPPGDFLVWTDTRAEAEKALKAVTRLIKWVGGCPYKVYTRDQWYALDPPTQKF
jgi:hypothetical protein